MSEQFNIFDGYGDQDIDTGRDIDNKFRIFHLNNPVVYKDLVKMTRKIKKHGEKKVGIAMLFEVLRWQSFMRKNPCGGDFKLNNDYRSRYARLIMEQEKDLEGIFELRELRS